jgi:uncharacterized protein
MHRITRFLTVFTLGMVVISFANFWMVVRPARFFVRDTPERYNLPAQDVIITAPDGTNLSAWYIPGDNTDPALILLHGYPVEKSDMLSIAAELHPDMSLLLLDMRYFGESEGRFTTLGVKEPDDVRAAVAYLQEQGHERIGIFGFSFGGVVALMTAAQDPAVNAVGAYAPYATLRQLGYELFWFMPGINVALVELMNMWSGVFFGYTVISSSPLRAAPDITVPTLIVHSEEDEQISVRHARRLRDALAHNEQAQVYIVDAGRHGFLPHDFYDRLRELMDD